MCSGCDIYAKTLYGPGNLVKTGYDFGGWSEDAEGFGTVYQPGPSSYTGCGPLYAVWIPGKYTLTAVASPPNSGTVTVIPNKANYDHGDQVMLTAKANTDYNFKEWSWPISSTNTSITITMDGDKTLFAVFGEKDKELPPRFTITFNSNGGGNNPQAAIADSGTGIQLPDQQTMQKAGYSFGGWNTNSGGTGTAYPANSPYTVTWGITLFAVWTPVNYNITYTLNGGSVTSANPTGYTIETASFTLNNPSRTGYTFSGWTGSNGTTAQTSVTVAKGTSGDLNYIANWTLNTYTITFNANSGTVTPASGVTGDGGKLSSLPTPTRDGYTFGGWFTTSAATGGTQVTESYAFSANTTVYARWTLGPSCNIIYTLNGGSVTPSNPISYTVETPSFTLNNPTRTGYTFAGWTGSNGTIPQTSVTVAKGTTSCDLNYIANWTLNTYTVTFNANNGTVTPTSSTTGEGWKLSSLPTPTRNGYTFGGWFTATTGGSAVTESSTFSAHTTIYARWTLIDYKITYTLNGATTTPSNPASYTIETASFILNPPSRTCYTFAGWTGSNVTTAQTSVTVAQGGTGEKSYVANWNAITYTLTTNVSPAGGGTVSRNPNQTAPYSCGTSVTVTAAPASGYVFTKWSGASTSSNASVSVTMNSDLTLTANFRLYKTVTIGGKIWMAENLNYDTANGTGSWCYGNSQDSCTKYGRLYNWNTAMAGASSSTANPSGRRGVCPSGWHLPSRAEWSALVTTVGSTVGKKLKAKSGWNDYNGASGNGTDDYGFSALPGGRRGTDGYFYGVDNYGRWWTATEYDASYAYYRHMNYDYDYVLEGYDPKEGGFAVRCVRD
jgi:uncharacterized protein (TIGR02145 family)/uncharacterized repeat protein (TIGR02543 family)